MLRRTRENFDLIELCQRCLKGVEEDEEDEEEDEEEEEAKDFDCAIVALFSTVNYDANFCDTKIRVLVEVTD